MQRISGVGLGLRREMLDELCEQGIPEFIDFFEVAPENWLKVNPRLKRQFQHICQQRPMICHGLSLSIGAAAPLDEAFVKALKGFFDEHDIALYSEHLSYCSGNAHLYDLMPIPFTDEAIKHVAQRVKQVQDILERPLVLENISYYAAAGSQMDELTFLQAVLNEADCGLLLDVNNVYVNSVNHNYDPSAFLRALPTERVRYLHIAGHYREADDLIVDTHGAAVVDPVWQLLDETYAHHGVQPTLLERDFNLPPMAELLTELEQIQRYQQVYNKQRASA